MSKFYTNVQSMSGHIFYRGFMDGKRVKAKIEYGPSLFLPTHKQTKFKSLDGLPLEEKKFDTIFEARDFVKKFDGMPGAPKIYGQTRFEYSYIADQHPDMVDYDPDLITVGNIDIEVGSENGFPDPYEANEPITAICLKNFGGDAIVWACGDYDYEKDKENTGVNITYVKCRDEWTLCKTFLKHWKENAPDIITGWNIKFFDIPYLVNRFRRILGEDETKFLSPWKIITDRKAIVNKRALTEYTLIGISTLDYLELYRWYAPNGKSQENYRLDTIANSEIGENKLSYEEYDSLHDLYRLNHQKFIEYNIKDVRLVERIDEKLKLVELAITIGYDTKSNFEDVFAQTRMWDSMTYCYLYARNIIVPPREKKDKDAAFEGAYVKVPQIGLHHWVASFDLNSLYPHLMMQYNISPETLVDPSEYTQEMRDILAQSVSVDKMLLKSIDLSNLSGVTMTPNGQFFRTDKAGFLPEMLEAMYNDRKTYKKMMLTAKQQLEDEPDESKHYEIEKRIAKYNNIQLAKKVGLNSAYGALGSQYFRFYDLRMALGVTTAGQLSIRWIENKINEYVNKLVGTNEEDYVIASDTDSIYLNLGPLIGKFVKEGTDTQKVITIMDKICEDKIQPYIDKSYKELAEYVHAYRQKMEMKREGLSDKGIWTAKKRYILNVYNNEGVQYNEPDLKVMGLEMVKSSTPVVVRTRMKELIRMMVSGTEKEVQDYIAEFREVFYKLPAEEISSPRGCNGIANYSDKVTLYTKGTPLHVKGAILYNHYLKDNNLDKKYPLIQEGEKIKYTYLKVPNHFKDTVVSFPGRLPPEFGLQEYIDYDTQFDKAFLDPIKVILDAIGWKVEKTTSIEDFFT